jgi:hypothetical protein
MQMTFIVGYFHNYDFTIKLNFLNCLVSTTTGLPLNDTSIFEFLLRMHLPSGRRTALHAFPRNSGSVKRSPLVANYFNTLRIEGSQ